MEFRFLQDFGGITTLEDCLVHSHHRLNSDVAIRLFKKYVDYQSGDFISKRYNRVFKGLFKPISYSFIEALTEIKWQGHWEEDQVLSSKLKDILYYKIYSRVRKFIDGNNKYLGRYYPTRDMYFSNPTLEEFQRLVKNYLNELFSVIDKSHKFEYLFFDQMLPPVNVNRYFDYFDDLHLIVVDRDPRDYYIENVFRWGDLYFPHEVNDFIKYYKKIRTKISEQEDHKNVLRVKMEDTIYNYEVFSKKINEFIGLDEKNHIHPKTRFNPEISINNTHLWTKREVDMDIIKRLEDNLGEYCYNFDI